MLRPFCYKSCVIKRDKPVHTNRMVSSRMIPDTITFPLPQIGTSLFPKLTQYAVQIFLRRWTRLLKHRVSRAPRVRPCRLARVVICPHVPRPAHLSSCRAHYPILTVLRCEQLGASPRRRRPARPLPSLFVRLVAWHSLPSVRPTATCFSLSIPLARSTSVSRDRCVHAYTSVCVCVSTMRVLSYNVDFRLASGHASADSRDHDR